MKKILVNGQWQGGADLSVLHGAKEIESLYLNGIHYDTAYTSDDKTHLTLRKNILGYEILRKQMEQTLQALKTEQPTKLFTIGGGCDADFPSIAYMNEKYKGNLKVLYFDAHGDINAPEESESKLFYGMLLRCLIENSPFSMAERSLKPEQLISIGARDLDNSELHFMSETHISRVTIEDVLKDRSKLKKLISAKNQKFYIHLDLDVLEPQEFPHTPLPVPNGLPVKQLYEMLAWLKENCAVVGFGIFEYAPCGQKSEVLHHLIQYGLDF